MKLIISAINRLKKLFRSDNSLFSRRWPLLFWSGVIFCFVIFPLFLIDVGLDSYLATRKELQKKELFKKLNQRLEQLLQYGNSRFYYHALLKKTVAMALKSKDPLAYLEKALPHLKERNPQTFRFIVWDKSGKLVDKLSDEKRYKYIVRLMYEAFSLAAKDVLENYPGNPGRIDMIDKRINLLRSYLGAFFIPERLNLPFLRGILGECILASSNPEKSHFWYQINDQFGIFANIHVNAIESNDHLKKIVASINRHSEQNIKCGIAELIKNQKLFTDKKLPFKREVLIELGKFMNTSETEVETAKQLMVIKPVTPFVLGFCTMPAAKNLLDVNEARARILISALFLFFLAGSLMAYLIFKSGFFSIRYKLALLFIYANGLPLLILGFLGFEYQQQVRMKLLDQAHKEISSLLSDVDLRFENVIKRYQDKSNQICQAINEKFTRQQVQERDFTSFEENLVNLKPTDLVVVDREGKFKIFRCSGTRADKFIANLGKNLLKYANSTTLLPFSFFSDAKLENRGSNIRAQSIISDDAIVFDEVLQRLNKVNSQQMAAEERFYYWSLLGNSSKRDFSYLTMVSWDQDVLQEKFLREFLKEFNRNQDKVKFFAMIETNGLIFPTDKIAPEIANLFQQVFNLKVVRRDKIKIGTDEFVAMGSVGKEMNKTALIGLFPISFIENQVAGLRLKLIAFACLSLILTSGIGTLLAHQFLEPVKELEKGVKAIGEQNFRYRIPIFSADEFGHLGSVFNRAIESLEDLEVAKIVQENLFPLEPLQQNSLEVFGRSVSMTRLGGDYYDYYSIDEDYTGILMGDVAGHGVPAALLMAMAKASVLLADEQQRHSPAALLSELHKVIYRVKSSKIKRMMTCQYFSINSLDGSFKFANAGHCFPLILRRHGEHIEQLKQVGTPLGITKKARYQDQDFQLEDGDIVLLYTDGIIETKNEQGLEMGFERFENLVKQSFNSDLEHFYQSIFDAYLAWSPTAEDDITMVLFKFRKTGEKS